MDANTIQTPAGHPAAGLVRRWTEKNHFVLRRLHSLLGVLPLGAFLFEHLWTNATAVYGGAERGRVFEAQVAALNQFPLIWLVELTFIWLPLLYHTFYGLFIFWEGRNNPDKYPFARNWMFTAQRVSGVLMVIFLVYHVGHWRFGWFGEYVRYWEYYPKLMEMLQHPGYFAFYVVGVTLVTFHFCNGLSTFMMTWGLTRSRAGQRRFLPVAGALFVGLTYLGINTLYHFHSGGKGLRIFYRPDLQIELNSEQGPPRVQ